MKRILLVISFAFSLGGCATVQAINGFSVTQGQLDAAESVYDGTVLAPLHKYAALKACTAGQTFTPANPCHDKVLLKRLRAGDKVAVKAMSDTQAAITSGDNTGAVAAYNTMKTAIDAAQSLITISGASTL
jgi:hypothetical protein